MTGLPASFPTASPASRDAVPGRLLCRLSGGGDGGSAGRRPDTPHGLIDTGRVILRPPASP